VRGNQIDAARACGQSLGAASDRYGSGDVADDVDDVRAALGIAKIDYYGVSYGPVDVRAYAYRHPDHLHAAVLDSPDFSSDDAFFRTLPGAMAKITVRVCQRSPACSAGERHPAKTLAALVARVRAHPVTGTGFDAGGRAHRVKVDEIGLLNILYDDYFADPAFLNQGELFAAAHALAAGDRTPLLRLAAESNAPTDFGPSNGSSSVGADYAVFCSDSVFPWDKSAPEATRRAQYEAAAKAVPNSATAPFTVAAWTGFVASQPVLLIPGADACTPWPAPVRPEPPFPPRQPWPAGIPALLMGGGLDYLDVAAERTLLPLFPAGTPFVTIANGGHVTSLWSNCAAGIAVHFLETLKPGDTRCAANTKGQTAMPFGAALGKLQIQGVSGFPRRAGRHPRRAARLAWDAVEDAVYQSFRLTGRTGRGLRGGTFTLHKDRIVLHGARFATDVRVTGKVTFTRTTSRVRGTIRLAGALRGRLRVTATLWDARHPKAFVKGTVGGRRVAIRPAAR
jgi:pimeloyl-ACP methyl ester carboxylesterase